MKKVFSLFSRLQLLIEVISARTLAMTGFVAVILAACGSGAQPVARTTPEEGGKPSDVIVYASDLPDEALFEFEVWDDPASPGGRLVGTPNEGGHLDPPPEDDPHVTFQVPVQSGVPYRCWIHMKVGEPKGQSQANLLWVQFTDAVNKENEAIFALDTDSYMTAQGPEKEGWTWVECDGKDAGSRITFQNSGDVTVRLQAGMEGVGFDQFLLSPTRYLEQPPAEAIVQPQASSEQPAAARPTQAPVPTPTPEATTTSKGAEKPFENFNPADFDDSTEIDNEWMPLKPGTRFVYEGTTVEDDGTVVPHRVVINVTDLTKEIGGIPTVVSWDLDYSNDNLMEAELAFFAQDKDGNVWRMGEYPEEYDEGKFVAAPTWIHGLADARAGIMMKAEPQLGTPSYAQGWGPAVDWTDRGQVDQMGQKVCVPVDCYEDVLVIAETSQAEPDAQQLKYYARGVGNVKVGWRGGGEKTKEVLELVKVEQLSPEALAEVRAEALKLEKHAYEVSKDVYAQTPPAK